MAMKRVVRRLTKGPERVSEQEDSAFLLWLWRSDCVGEACINNGERYIWGF